MIHYNNATSLKDVTENWPLRINYMEIKEGRAYCHKCHKKENIRVAVWHEVYTTILLQFPKIFKMFPVEGSGWKLEVIEKGNLLWGKRKHIKLICPDCR